MSGIGSRLKNLRDDPATAHAGTAWSKPDDTYLMASAESKLPHIEIATTLKRTVGSIVARIKQNVYDMIDDQNPLDALCIKYTIDLKDMQEFKSKKDSDEIKKVAEKLIKKPIAESSAAGEARMLTEIRDLLLIVVKNTTPANPPQ
jgi:hypothetical protein